MRLLHHKVLRPLILSHREARHIRARRGERVNRVPLRKHVAEVQDVLCRQVMVHAHSELVVVLIQRLRGAESVWSQAGLIGQREEGQERLCKWIDAGKLVEGECVLGKRQRRKGIDELARGDTANTRCVKGPLRLRAKQAKISLPFLLGEYVRANRFTLAVAQAFVIPEEKSFVFLDGSAESSAELIALQGLYAGRKETLRVHGVVPQEFPGRAMKCVGAGARNDVGR